MEARGYAADDVLRDGASVRIRAIGAEDKARLAAFHRRLSPESVYFRFFEYKQALSPKDLRYLTEVDFDRRVALVATLAAGPDAPIVGVARFDVLPGPEHAPLRAELGIVVEDAQQNRGIGTVLLKHGFAELLVRPAEIRWYGVHPTRGVECLQDRFSFPFRFPHQTGPTFQTSRTEPRAHA
jgi:GNAT superfamily N-acetyltransferase